MKNITSILLCFLGGALMIVGSATGSATFYFYLTTLFSSYISPEFMPLVASILTVLEYIAFYGGYSVIVGAILILINQIRLGKIIIMVATGFGMLGLVFYAGTYILGISGIAVSPAVQTILIQIYTMFTYNSGLAFSGTAIAVVGRFGIEKPKKEEKDVSTEKAKSKDSIAENLDSKFCPKCGEKLPIKANFCNQCGTTFD
jgi:ribosomal protein L40E